MAHLLLEQQHVTAAVAQIENETTQPSTKPNKQSTTSITESPECGALMDESFDSTTMKSWINTWKQSLQVAFNGQSTAELTTCMMFIDTLSKHYPAIVVLRPWARHIGRPVFLMEVAALN